MRLWVWVVWLATSAVAPPAYAQRADDAWVVVGVSDPRTSSRIDELMQRAAAQLAAAGHHVLPDDNVRAVVERTLSAPFRPVSAELRDAISQAGERALRHVARGQYAEAREVASPVLSQATEHLAAVGHDPQVSVDLVNLCLFVVRSHLGERDRASASARVAECIRMAPSPEFAGPDPHLHPPEVGSIYTEVREAIGIGQGAASLTIQLSRAYRAPCSVRLNGWRMGDHRTLRVFVPAGSYDVQVECAEGVPGRVRRVEAVVDRPVRVVVDPSLDAAMANDPLRLEYSSVPDDETVLRHVAVLAESARATEALLVTFDGDRVELRRVPAAARARLGGDTSDDELSRAIDAIVAGRSYEAEGGTAAGSDAAHLRDSEPSRPIVGPVLLGVAGLAAVGIAIGSVVAAGCVERDPTGFCTAEDRVAPLPVGLYAAGGGLAIVGAILWFFVGGGSDDGETDLGAIPLGGRF